MSAFPFTTFVPKVTTITSTWLQAVNDRIKSYIQVNDYGAVGDGLTDDTAAIQAAINAGGTGSTIYFPPGKYLVSDTLTLFQNQKLVGTADIASFKAGLYAYISTLYVVTGQGSTTTPAVLLDLGSGVDGLCFYYPTQVDASQSTPIQFGYTIATNTARAYNLDDVTVTNTMLVNSYLGISMVNSGRFVLDNIYGDCILNGLLVDTCYDTPHISNVHFWTFTYTPGTNLYSWISNNGTGFTLCRCDGAVINNAFVYGRARGWYFSSTGSGSFWGSLYGCGADSCNFPCIVSQINRLTWHGGYLITNAEAQNCVSTSTDASGGSGIIPYVVFDSVWMHPNSEMHFVISSTTGRFIFANCLFQKNNSNATKCVGLNTSTATVHVTSPTNPGVADSTLYVAGMGGNTYFNGQSNPAASTDVTPSNFDMAAWVGGVPTGWTFISGSSAVISQITGGIQLITPSGVTTYNLSYTMPSSVSSRPTLYLLGVDVVHTTSPVGNCYLVFRSRTGTYTDEMSPQVFYNYPHLTKQRYYLPILTGYDPADTAEFQIEWSSSSADATIQLTNLKLYEAAASTITQAQLDMLTTSLFADPLGYGFQAAKVGGRLVVRAAAAPAAGDWLIGDQVMNIAPAAGQPKGWVCTVAGSPGTWVSLGNL